MEKFVVDPLDRWLETFCKTAQQITRLPSKPHRLSELKIRTGLTPRMLSHQLSLAGWHKEHRVGTDIDGIKKRLIWWSPPGQRAPRIPRSRYEWLHAST